MDQKQKDNSHNQYLPPFSPFQIQNKVTSCLNQAWQGITMGLNNTKIISTFGNQPCETNQEDVKMLSTHKSDAKFSNNSETKADILL